MKVSVDYTIRNSDGQPTRMNLSFTHVKEIHDFCTSLREILEPVEAVVEVVMVGGTHLASTLSMNFTVALVLFGEKTKVHTSGYVDRNGHISGSAQDAAKEMAKQVLIAIRDSLDKKYQECSGLENNLQKAAPAVFGEK